MKKVELESLEAVHTHTHTHTSRLLVKNIKIDNKEDSNKSLLSRLLLLSFRTFKSKRKLEIGEVKGITLISLIVTIVVLLILASIATYSGVGIIRQSKLNRFTTEMKVMQTEVNDLYDRYSNGKDVLNLGKELDGQADKVFTSEASGITDKTGYRYYDQETIQRLGIDGVEEEFFVNVEKRSVVSYLGFEYEGTTYYTLDQLPNGLYNVEYEDKNAGGPTFDLSCDNWTNGRSNIKISNIEYNDGYIDKWEVKYKLEGQDYWSTSEDLSFFVDKPGMYTVKIVNGNIESEEKQIEAVKANAPEMLEGMTETTFKLPEGNAKGETIKLGDTAFNSNIWYDYGNKKWANSTTEDGSMWVWIPRFAYKITYEDPSDKSKGGTIDVKFLIEDTDQYYDNGGNIQTAKRATSKDEIVDTTSDYYVHPAFTDESSIDYANGGWDKELTGIWVAKFEAGYASGNNNAEVKASNVNYSQNICTVSATELGRTAESNYQPARNWLDGVYSSTTTLVKYPTFQAITYSMNFVNINDAYNVSRGLTDKGNIYGLNNLNTDSHLIKNSEWGAIAYLSWSKYGTNAIEAYMNNINLNSGSRKRTETVGKSGIDSLHALTGVTTGKTNDEEKITTESDINGINNRSGNIPTNGIYAWDQEEGQKSSSTLNMYGVYDLSGGLVERTAGYIANGNEFLKSHGESLTYDGDTLKGTSTKYTTVYPYDVSSDNLEISQTDENAYTACVANYLLNIRIFGDAIRETSTRGFDNTSWNNDGSYFPGLGFPFTHRGGRYLNGESAGIFYFRRNDGDANYNTGFRSVLIPL